MISVVKNNICRSPQEILDELFLSSSNFSPSTKWEDDATLIIVKKD
jgi:serine phosphatase RsbU (regulator of sigma subunit)